MQSTLSAALWPIAHDNPIVRNATLAFASSILLAISAKLSIPFFPVPMTLQTLVVLLLGMAYGWKLGGATVLLYLAEGAVGLPVFSGTPEKGMGIAYMLGSTGGYLLGFLLATIICGYLAERGWGKTPMTTAAAMLLGNVAIYIPGLLWLGTLFGWDKPILQWGLIPFLLGDAVKLLLATALLPLAWKWVQHRS